MKRQKTRGKPGTYREPNRKSLRGRERLGTKTCRRKSQRGNAGREGRSLNQEKYYFLEKKSEWRGEDPPSKQGSTLDKKKTEYGKKKERKDLALGSGYFILQSQKTREGEREVRTVKS